MDAWVRASRKSFVLLLSRVLWSLVFCIWFAARRRKFLGRCPLTTVVVPSTVRSLDISGVSPALFCWVPLAVVIKTGRKIDALFVVRIELLLISIKKFIRAHIGAFSAVGVGFITSRESDGSPCPIL